MHSNRAIRIDLPGTFSAAAIVACAMLLIGLFGTATAARADQPPDQTQRELRIERTLACPQCTDLPLDVCDQDICNDMRAIVHQRVAAGESDAAIRQYFVERYGTRVLLAPPKDSSGLIAWALPFLALLFGAALTTLYFRSARRKQLSAKPERPPPMTPDDVSAYRSRVEREIGELE